MKIYLIRHGETDWNVVKRLQGRSDIALNHNGIELAKKTGEALKEAPFTRIYTRPLKRAKETALCIKGDREIPVIEEDRLMEISFGVYEGLCSGKDNYTIPDPEFKYFFDKPEAYHPPEGGESIAELCVRTSSFLQEIVDNPSLQEETILISTHGAALMGLLSRFHNDGIAGFWQGGVHKNCAVTILNVCDGNVTVEEMGKVFAT